MAKNLFTEPKKGALLAVSLALIDRHRMLATYSWINELRRQLNPIYYNYTELKMI